MHIAMGADGAAKGGVDLVVAQVHVDTAVRTNCRGGRRIQLLPVTTIEAGHGSDPRSMPDVLQAAQERLGLDDAAQLKVRLRRDGRRRGDEKMPAALPAERALGRGIFVLFEATVRTLHTDLDRRLGHKLIAWLWS